ncbi:MAG: LPS export ABC transporter periplasmic protein LptC [Xanthomonadales bacterium]|jgi:LPS export ABC transporter protein LptC|nr:LPS export ABC transporter periplasmic protein LptC [Xanthomonadales bacterium]
MMTPSTRRGLLVATALVAVTFWLTRGEDETDPGIEGLDTGLSYALENFEMQAYDELGAPAVRLWAPRFINEADTNIGRVDNPRLEVRHEGLVWRLTAETATIAADQDEVYLNGAVQIERTGATPADRVDIDTRNVTLEVDPRVAHSGEAIRVRDSSGVLNAKGFRVDMVKDEFQLHNDVQGVYVVPN